MKTDEKSRSKRLSGKRNSYLKPGNDVQKFLGALKQLWGSVVDDSLLRNFRRFSFRFFGFTKIGLRRFFGYTVKGFLIIFSGKILSLT